MSGSSVGGATLTNANAVGTFGGWTDTGGGSTGLSFSDGEALTITAVVSSASGPVSLITNAGNLTLAAGAAVTGNGVALATPAAFINLAGAAAVTATGGSRWLVYSSAPGADTFGGLDSGDTALWNATFASLPPASVTPTGDRYLFAQGQTLTVTTTNASKVYGQDATAAVASDFTISGFAPGVAGAFLGDTAATATAGAPSVTSPGSAVTASVLGGPYAITASAGSLTSPAGYAFTFVSPGELTVTPAPLTASIIGDPTKVYDATTTAALASANFGLAGFVAGQGATVSALTGAYNSPNVVSATTVTATLAAGDFTANAGTVLSNYTLPTTASGPGAITPASLTASIIGDPTKVYDGTTTATLASANFAVTGFVTGQGATLSPPTSGAYNSANVVSATTVTAALTAGDFTANAGTLLSNYTLPTNASGAGAITPATLTASITGDPTKVYDSATTAALPAGEVALAGFVTGQGATSSALSGAYNSADVVSATTVTASVTAGEFTANAGTLLSNYALPATASGAGAITPAALTASIIGDPTKVYDGTTTAALASGDFALTGFVTGQGATLSPPSTGAYNSANVVSATTVTAALTAAEFTANAGTSLSNYTLPTSASGAGAITPATLTASIIGDPTKVYDGTTTAAVAASDVALAGFVTGQGATSLALTGAYNSPNVVSATTVTAALTASEFTANAGTLLSNYSLPATASGAGAIAPATLTASIIGDPTKVYDGTTTAAIAGDFALTGFVTGEGATVAALTGAYNSADVVSATTVTAALTAAEFTANAGTLLSNYTLPTTASGAGAITPASLTASIIGDPTKVYDGTTTAALPAGEVALAGFVAGQGATSSALTGAYNSANVVSATTVTAAIAASEFTANAGTLLSNYMLPAAASGAGAITPAALTASIVGDPTKVYDATTTAALPAGEVGLAGFVTGQGATSSALTGAYNSADVVSATTVTAALTASEFTANAGTLLSNYTLPTNASGPGAITPATLTASIIGDPTKVYDATTTAAPASANFAVTGFVAGQGATVSALTGAYNSANVVSATTVTAALTAAEFTANAGTLLSNYTLPTTASGAGAISPATLTASIIGDPTKVYDGTTTATLALGDFALAGFVAGQGATLSPPTTGAYNSANVVSATTVTAALTASEFAANAGTLLSNYTLPTTASGPGAITPASLTIAANNANKVYGDSLTFAGTAFSASGLLASDKVTGVSLTSPGAAATAQVAGSPYPIIASNAVGAGLSNYSITYLPGALTVTPRPITVTADDLSRFEGAPNPPLAFTVTTGSLANGDLLSGTLATTATIHSPEGSYAITQGTLAATPNYLLSFVDGELVVTPPDFGISPNRFIPSVLNLGLPQAGPTPCTPADLAAIIGRGGKAVIFGLQISGEGGGCSAFSVGEGMSGPTLAEGPGLGGRAQGAPAVGRAAAQASQPATKRGARKYASS